MNMVLEMLINTWKCQSHTHFLILSISRPYCKGFMAYQTSYICPELTP